MKIGDLVHVQSLTTVKPGVRITHQARIEGEPRVAGKTPVFAILILGADVMEQPTLDPAAVLRSLGWIKRLPRDRRWKPWPPPKEQTDTVWVIREDDLDEWGPSRCAYLDTGYTPARWVLHDGGEMANGDNNLLWRSVR
jgi:hypothetical protein